MSGFVFHPDALADLNEICEFIATDALSAADRVLNEIQETIRALVSFPQLGHRRFLFCHPPCPERSRGTAAISIHAQPTDTSTHYPLS